MRDSIIRNQTDNCSRKIPEEIGGDVIQENPLTGKGLKLFLDGKELTCLLTWGMYSEKFIELLL